MADVRQRRSRKQTSTHSKSESVGLKEKRLKSAVPPFGSDPPNISTREYVALGLFTLAAFAIRFYRIGSPAAVVFDELHFSKFIDRLLTKTWFFDIHPPLGKLILAYGSHLLGYRPEPTFVIEKIGNPYPEHVKYFLVRYVSASFSVATVPLTYLISRNLLISPISSALTTASVLFEFLGIIEGRLILMDSQLLFFCQLALLCALRLWRTHSKTRNRTKWLCLTGLAAGAAFSIKHTALATPGLIAVISFFGLHFLREPLTLLECLFAGACGFVVYTVPFYIVFNTLWHAGGKYDKFMPMNFRSTLIGSENYSPSAKRRPFWELFIYLNKRMVQSNASIKKRHTWESDWYQWIVNWRGVLYFLRKEDVDGKQMRTQIYLLGNPVVIYLTLMCVVSFAVIVMFSVRYREMFKMRASYSQVTWLRSTGTFLLSGWLCNLLPYILVDRAAFIYHYMPGLFYGQLLTGVMFDFFPPRARLVLVVIVIFAMMSAFVYWSPWIYGIALENDAHVKRRWLPRWT